MKRLPILLLIFLCILPQPLWAQFEPGQAESLAGIRSLNARVSIADDPILPQAQGLDAVLKTRMELALRREGIGVSEDALQYLTFSVTILRDPAGLVSYGIQLQLVERLLVRGRMAWAATWERLGLRTGGENSFRAGISDASDEYMTGFLNDYLRANPKGGGTSE